MATRENLKTVDDIRRSLERLHDRFGGMEDTMRAVEAELGGALKPELRQGRPTIRDRIHVLENDKSAAQAAQAALAAAQASNAQAWTRLQKIALFGIAVVGMVLGILAAVGITS